ncbi:MAG: hypothetical protein U9N87_05220 [Planctomycetota bacterium]|nr:hypothetical protein [Planctomycetota bacterium]
MANLIRIVCPGCGVKIKAKEKLAGKTRTCPKCGEKIVVPKLEAKPSEAAVAETTVAEADEAAPAVEIIQANQAETRLPSADFPERLNRRHRYLICDKTRLLATWRDNGQSWLVKGASGFMSAKRNTENLPAYGQFTLVELELELTDDGLRLAAITSYKLASRFAMTKLALGDDDIMRVIEAHGSLNRDQKNAVRSALKDQFMREVWGDSTEVTEYLSNADYHSASSRGE